VSAPWWSAFGPAEAPLNCGDAEHRLRWANGRLHTLDHADAEGELVLAALGGDTSPCLDVVRAWGGHSDDLTVLAVGPRSHTDAVTIPAAVLDEVNELSDPAGQGQHGSSNLVAYRRRSGRASFGVVGGMSSVTHATYRGSPGSSPRTLPKQALRQAAFRGARLRARSGGWTGSRPLRTRSFPGRGGFARFAHFGWPGAEADQARLELIRLLALGAPFQFRLCAAVAHAWSAEGEHASRAGRAGPALTAALAGRLAPAAAQWLGVDPSEIDVTIHAGAGWGEITRALVDGNARLQAKLPVAWLAKVWAPDFAVVGSHLVVDVLRASWPQASVLALGSPGQEPVRLDIRQEQGHWSVMSR
jgi:hypothetical protein